MVKKSLSKIAKPFVLLLVMMCFCASGFAQLPKPTRTPRVRVVDLDEGETQKVTLCNGESVTVKLVSVKETIGKLRGAVRDARVVVEVDGERLELVSAHYQLPKQVGDVHIDCPVTSGFTMNSRGNPWALDKRARLRLWSVFSSLIDTGSFGYLEPGTFGYPVKQRWFAGMTQMANEPTFVDGGEVPGAGQSIYYHYGLDFGGAEGMVEVVAATDGLVVSAGDDKLPGCEGTPVRTRYDVIYILDDRGWFYRYSHLKEIDAAIKPGAKVQLGQRLGLMGKEGGSGGWSHLHFDISSMQPSGRWGIQDGYAFIWDACFYRTFSTLYGSIIIEMQPLAVARPHRVAFTGEPVHLDGRLSVCNGFEERAKAKFEWTFTDGSHDEGETVTRTYHKPGEYSEILKVTNGNGLVSYDFAVVQVFDRKDPKPISTIHPAYYPTTDIKPGDEITFMVRSFRAAPGEIWDFGDGSPKVNVKSDGNAKVHAADGYAVTTHAYKKPGDYIVRVEHTAKNGQQAMAHLHVHVEDEQTPVYGNFERYFQVPGDFEDPYDTQCVAVDAVIWTPDRTRISLPLFFDGDKGWGLRFTPSEPGDYDIEVLVRRGGGAAEKIRTCSFTVSEKRQDNGFIRISKKNPRHFAFDDGRSYFPLGENMGWLRSDDEWERYLKKLGDTGANWIRIWMCSWGKLALVWGDKYNSKIYHGLNAYSLVNARRFDKILSWAARNGIYIQLVFNNHGQFSSRTNPEWRHNPYNKANGGFLDTADQFFTHPECKRRYKDRLRYLVARYGWSTHIFAWEFWNEVNLTDNYDPAKVGAWHGEMAQVLKTLDPFDHPVTTSGSGSHRGHQAFEGMDFLQGHEYTADVIGAVLAGDAAALKAFPDMPHFFGELGSDWRGPPRSDKAGVCLHDMLWASIHGGGSGTAMTWWWDNWVEPCGLYHHFRHAADYVKGIDWVAEEFKPVPATVAPRDAHAGAVTILPMGGWRKARRDRFVIPQSGNVEGLRECPGFLQGKAHPDLRTEPVFTFTLPKHGAFEISLNTIARAGAALVVTVNGEEKLRRSYERGDRDYSPKERMLQVALPAGNHTIKLSNPGSDWVKVSAYRIHGLGQRLMAAALAGRRTALVWIKDRGFTSAQQGPEDTLFETTPTTVTITGLQSGRYAYERWEPWTGKIRRRSEVDVKNGTAILDLPAFKRAAAFRLVWAGQ